VADDVARAASSRDREYAVAALAIAVVVAALFARALACDFFQIDDYDLVLDNEHVNRGLSLEAVAWALTNPLIGNWTPLAWLSHMLDVSLFGANAAGHHATSVALHAATSALLFVFFARATNAPVRSAIAVLAFALHPMRVESVVWVAERRDVLSGFFGAATLCAWASFVRTRQPARYAAALALAACALASKATLVTLPFVLLLADVWPLGRASLAAPARESARALARLAFEKLPFFALAAVASTATLLAQGDAGAVVPSDVLPLSARLANAVLALEHYLEATLAPVHLSVMVLHPALFGGPGSPPLAVAASLAFLVLVSVLAFHHRARGHPVVGWLWFLGALVPTLGLVQAGIQGLAYRYTYFPHVGLAVLLVWTGADLVERAARERAWMRPLAAALALAMLGALGARTVREIGAWRTTESLFLHNIAIDPSAWNHYFYLGNAYLVDARPGDAIAPLEAARARLPRQGGPELRQAWANLELSLGKALDGAGRTGEAIDAYRRSLAIAPRAEVADRLADAERRSAPSN